MSSVFQEDYYLLCSAGELYSRFVTLWTGSLPPDPLCKHFYEHTHTHTWSQNKNIHLHTQNQQGGPLLHNRENSQTEDNTLRTRVNIDNAWKEKMSDIQKKQLHFVELKTYFFQLSWLPHYLISTFPVTTISSSSFFYPFVPHLYTDVLQYLCPHLKVPAGLFPPNSPLCILHTKNHWTENVWMFLA